MYLNAFQKIHFAVKKFFFIFSLFFLTFFLISDNLFSLAGMAELVDALA